jgi:hypothetical protein
LLVYLNGTDRTSLNLDIDGASSGDDIVSAVGMAQPNTVVVTISPGPYLTNWSTHIKALVDFGFPGEQEGEAVCDILFGIANPAGKMPHTMPHVWNEVQMTTAQCVVLPSSHVVLEMTTAQCIVLPSSHVVLEMTTPTVRCPSLLSCCT